MTDEFNDDASRRTWSRMATTASLELRDGLSIGPLTTLQTGGAAAFTAMARTEPALRMMVEWAQSRRLPVALIGGGSNVVVSDSGFPGLLIRMLPDKTEPQFVAGSDTEIIVDAGLLWDDVVQWSINQGLNGLECLSGIPGRCGAAPIQNIGAYGVELSDRLISIDVMDLQTCEVRTLMASELGFGYRTSALREHLAGKLAVLRLRLSLHRSEAAEAGYEELRRALAHAPRPLSAGAVREAVLELRRSKSMVLSPDDPNTRSVGSFFVNPVVSADVAERIQSIAAGGSVPMFHQPDGTFKVAAAWLIEASGFRRGHAAGAAGLSSRHALALINRQDATTADIVRLAWRIHQGVAEKFGVRLRAEPVFIGELPPGLERAAALFPFRIQAGE